MSIALVAIGVIDSYVMYHMLCIISMHPKSDTYPAHTIVRYDVGESRAAKLPDSPHKQYHELARNIIHNSSPRTITSDGPSICTVSYAPESRCDGSINVDRFPMYDQFVRSRLVASFSRWKPSVFHVFGSGCGWSGPTAWNSDAFC